ncbi:50S ribosomal protein L29 [Ichthyobacterium seriolicida]|uniref:Large ribosomal subunit protein uL29 n=1 Tax=Ichthyobacterium seriolicida TaxID=242600 RepID=A0A1J1EBD1_9FLAO|nr:50S ribosomal protein L29 [Ichthyobacterium seriolicida]BAV94816.1 50S ribosomal protein L29 [Ichthyobacterium seriolicida]
MKQSEVNGLSVDQLKEKISEKKALYLKLKMEHAVTPLPNPMELRSTRRDISRINTELTKKIQE